MTVKELEVSGWIIFKCISGSKAYNLDTPNSDTDYRGVYVQPTEMILSNRYIPQISDEKNDIVYYEINRFLELLIKGSPNIIELLNIPTECILIQTDEYKRICDNKEKFLTKRLRHTFGGYALGQIKKAKSLNKKINNPRPVVRKTPLHFCYILRDAKSLSLLDYYTHNELLYCGLKKYEGSSELFTLYKRPSNFKSALIVLDMDWLLDVKFNGLIGEDSDELRVSDIPEEYRSFCNTNNKTVLLKYDKKAYSEHCKEYKEYWDWYDNKNEERYKKIEVVQYDTKAMMHCYRMLCMIKDIVMYNQINVKRENKSFLMKIRNGEIPYKKLIKWSETKLKFIDRKIIKSNLLDNVDEEWVKDQLLNIRISHLNLTI